MERIQTLDDIDQSLDRLMQVDPRLVAIREIVGKLPLRRSSADFHGLADIVVSQCVSKASAAAVMGRLTETLGVLTPREMILASDDSLAQVGLTRAKLQTLRELALAVESGQLNLSTVCELPADDAIAALTAFKGVGDWTAEVFLLFCGGHVDIFPAGDVALRTAIGDALAIEPRPSVQEVRQLSERWSPYRSVAARLFWSYYAVRRR